MSTIGANGSKTNVSPVPPVAGGGAAAASKPAAKSPVGGGGVPHIPPPAPPPVQTTEKPSTPLYEACKACTFKALDVAHKAAIVTSLKELIFTNSDEGALVKIDICLPQSTHPITSILCENDAQRKAIMVSLVEIGKAARAVTASDLAKHFDGMVKSGLDKLLIDCCVKDDEKAACAAACVSIAALPAESSTLAVEYENLTRDKAALSTRLNSAETTARLSAHQTLTTDTEALRLEIQALQQSQLMSISLDTAQNDIRTEVNAYNAEIQAQNTVLAAQKDAIVALGEEIQKKKTETASSLDPQKADLDARHVKLEESAQSLLTLKRGLTDDISRLDVMIAASNSGPLAYVCTEFVEAALSQWALAQLGPLATALGTIDQPASFSNALTEVQKKILDKTRSMTAAAFSPLYGTLNARPEGTDEAIDKCLTSISTQLAEFDSAYKAYSELKEPYKKEVTQFNTANATALKEVNTLVDKQAEAIATLERSLAAASVENDSKKSGLTEKITLLNEASQKAGTETSAITAKLNSNITQYNANIEKLKKMEADQEGLVAKVSSSNKAISDYNQAVADLETKVSVAKEDKAHIAQYNSSTSVQNTRKAIKLERMSNAPDAIAAFKARVLQSPPTLSAGASGSDPYLLISYDIREKFTPEDFSKLKIPPQIRQLDCRSLSPSFAPIAVATGKEIEPIQARLSEITVVIPKAEDCVSDITVKAATDIEREFPSIGMLANPNQPAITVRAPFITEEMLQARLDFLRKSGVRPERVKKWEALITAVDASKGTTCPVRNQANQAAFLRNITGQKDGNVWSSTQAENGELVLTYRLDYQMTAQPKAADNSTKTDTFNARIKALQAKTETLGKPPLNPA